MWVPCMTVGMVGMVGMVAMVGVGEGKFGVRRCVKERDLVAGDGALSSSRWSTSLISSASASKKSVVSPPKDVVSSKSRFKSAKFFTDRVFCNSSSMGRRDIKSSHAAQLWFASCTPLCTQPLCGSY